MQHLESSFTIDSSQFLDRGQGEPTLVFLHYFSGAAASWQWVIEHLASDFRCVALDLPGFGQTPPLAEPSLETYRDFVWEALSALDIDRFVLVGHSMGAKIALQVGISSPLAEPRQIILVAPSPPTQEPMPDDEKQRLLNFHPSQDNAATTVDQATHAQLSPEQRSLAIQTHTIAADSAWRWWLQVGMQHSIADQLHSIKVPVTVIASPDDPVIPFDVVQRDVIDRIAGATLIEQAGVGHLMPLEIPEKIAIAIRQQVEQGAAIAP
ncbi:alpha/beta fold hydrolase [Leptolyngbya iicbica]|uniref:Alpha/beta fold hydrolase n=2 Tax=Cyanophyceae TaxID=3028117 RepID=A0A4Q7E8I3_9CYAN|nr:alpha/beta fold hydrolase [Leptolyngbya sp. LK]RZM78659.1 alpha/beta fold hydrolase [Leptolyngbya sp. LK]